MLESIPNHASGPSSLLSGFRSVGIDPIRLEPGDYTIGIQAFYQSPDRYVHEAVYTSAPEISLTSYAHQNGSVLSYPTIMGEINEVGAWFGPNFWYLMQDQQ